MFPNVESLRFAHCSNLVEFPRIVHIESLKHLIFRQCKRLENFQEIGGMMESLTAIIIEKTAIKQIPPSIGYELVNLKTLFVAACDNLTTLPRSVYGLQHLENLQVYQCPKYTMLEENILPMPNSKEISLDNYNGPSSKKKSNDDQGNLPLRCVSTIWLVNCAIVSLPVWFSKFGQLTQLYLDDCTRLEEISELPPNLRKLNVSECVSLKRILKLSNFLKREESQMLEMLNLSGCQTLWANLVDEADKQGWLVNDLVEDDVMSLFLLSQQSAFSVVFPASVIPNKWLHYEMANHGTRGYMGVVTFDFEILPNFDWNKRSSLVSSRFARIDAVLSSAAGKL